MPAFCVHAFFVAGILLLRVFLFRGSSSLHLCSSRKPATSHHPLCGSSPFVWIKNCCRCQKGSRQIGCEIAYRDMHPLAESSSKLCIVLGRMLSTPPMQPASGQETKVSGHSFL